MSLLLERVSIVVAEGAWRGVCELVSSELSVGSVALVEVYYGTQMISRTPAEAQAKRGT